jgi:hypothetical protein
MTKGVKRCAKAEGTTFSDICRRAIECYMLRDPKVLEAAKPLGAAIGCHPMTVISNFAISKIAQRDAEIEAHGVTNRIYAELRKVDGKVVGGDKLYNALRKLYVSDIERKKKNEPKN